MTTRKPTAGFWITVALVVVLLGYPLSMGPGQWLLCSGYVPEPIIWINHVYDPLRWILVRAPDCVSRTFESYLIFWLSLVDMPELDR